jgi:hypothetical protein
MCAMYWVEFRQYRSRFVLLFTALLLPQFTFAGTQFSRQYNTTCSTCHTVYPQLNDLGKAFMDAGFQLPQKDGTPHTNSAYLSRSLASRSAIVAII